MRKRITILFYFSCLWLYSNSQSTFQKTWGGVWLDVANDMTLTSDGNFIITGATYNSNLNCNNILLLKINSMGDTLWTKVYGTGGGQEGYVVKETADKGFLIGGVGGGAIGSSSNDILVVKTDSSGVFQWCKAYGGYDIDNIKDMLITSDSGYIIAAETESFGYVTDTTCFPPGTDFNCPNLYLMKINGIGDTLWTKVIGSPLWATVSDIIKTQDSNYLITGQSLIGWVGGCFLLKFDESGNILWYKIYKNKLLNGKGLLEKPNGSLIVMGDGYWGSFTTTKGVFIMETDSIGNVQWIKITDNGSDSTAINEYSNKLLNESNGYLLLGFTSLETYNNYASSLYIKTDFGGNIMWLKRGSSGGGGDNIVKVDNNKYILAGSTIKLGKGDVDVYLYSIDSLGNSACNTYDMNLTMLNIDPATIQVIDTGFTAGGTNTIVIDYPLQQSYPELYMMDCDSFVSGEEEVYVTSEKPYLASFPNPFSDRTTIVFSAEDNTELSLSIYNVLGEKVAEILKGTVEKGKRYKTEFAGNSLPGGIYYCALETPEKLIKVIKLVIIR